MIPRAVEAVFAALEARAATHEVAVVGSFLEIYCDRIRDLGTAYLQHGSEAGRTAQRTSDWYRGGNTKAAFAATRRDSVAQRYAAESLRIHEDAGGNVFVKDLSVIPVGTPEEVMAMVQMGFRLRATHETKMNTVSSRSHTVLTLHVIQKDKNTGDTITGMLNMVDLAGSERLARSESRGQRMVEAMAINSSLSALGKVVMALQSGGGDPGIHVPYRISKLTRLLQNSLGGNSITSVLAAVHPRAADFDESMSTLQFAQRCRSVHTRPVVNHARTATDDKEQRLAALSAENAQLRRQVALMRIACDMRMTRLILELGLPGAMLPNGQFQLEDGTIIGMTDEEACRSQYAQRLVEDLSPSLLAREPSGSFSSGIAHGDASAMFGADEAARLSARIGVSLSRKYCGGQGGFQQELLQATERDALASSKSKVKATKKLLAEVRESARAEAEHLRQQVKAARATAEEAVRQAAEAQRSVEHEVEAARLAADAKVRTVMNEGTRMVETQVLRATARPDALLAAVSTPTPHTPKNVEQEYERRYDAHIATVRASAAAEVQLLQQKLKDTAGAAESARTELRREAQQQYSAVQERLEGTQEDLLRFVEYAIMLCKLVSDLRQGVFPILQVRGQRQVHVPKECLPPCPLFDKQRPAAELHHLLHSLGRPAPRLLHGQGKKPQRAILERSAAEHMAAADPQPVSTQRWHVTGSDGTEELDASADIHAMDLSTLQMYTASLQAMVKHGLRDKLEAQVLKEVSGHPTMQYIKKLEQQIKAYQAQTREDALASRSLRAALDAQRRLVSKGTVLPGISRPATASSVGTHKLMQAAASTMVKLPSKPDPQLRYDRSGTVVIDSRGQVVQRKGKPSVIATPHASIMSDATGRTSPMRPGWQLSAANTSSSSVAYL